MTCFIARDTLLPAYMVFPRFLLEKENLNETAKLLYVILLDRARMSQKNEGWTDEKGHVFIIYPIKDLAEIMHKSEMTVKTALSALEEDGLVVRKRRGPGAANHIYVKCPADDQTQTDRFLSSRQTKICTSWGKNPVPLTDRKLSGNNKDNNNIKRNYECTKEESL